MSYKQRSIIGYLFCHAMYRQTFTLKYGSCLKIINEYWCLLVFCLQSLITCSFRPEKEKRERKDGREREFPLISIDICPKASSPYTLNRGQGIAKPGVSSRQRSKESEREIHGLRQWEGGERECERAHLSSHRLFPYQRAWRVLYLAHVKYTHNL